MLYELKNINNRMFSKEFKKRFCSIYLYDIYDEIKQQQKIFIYLFEDIINEIYTNIVYSNHRYVRIIITFWAV